MDIEIRIDTWLKEDSKVSILPKSELEKIAKALLAVLAKFGLDGDVRLG